MVKDMYRKKYKLKKLKEDIDYLIAQGKKTINFLELITEVGFDPRDIKEIYKTLINGREYYMYDK